MIQYIIILVGLIGSCSNSNESAPQYPQSSSVSGSCLTKLTSGMQLRCMDYSNSSTEVITYAKSICGKAENGLDGYTWQNTKCSTSNLLGECQSSEYSYKDYYYTGYTLSSAKQICQSFSGVFVTKSDQIDSSKSGGSCVAISISGEYLRCLDYSYEESSVISGAKDICGRSDYGMGDYIWKNEKCSQDDIIGECDSPGSSYHDYYYLKYGIEAAKKSCSNTDGVFDGI